MNDQLTERLHRIEAIQHAIREARPRPDKMAAWFCASALSNRDGAIESLVEETHARHGEIISALGRHSAPSGTMRWAYAAMLAGREAEVGTFLRHRDTLRAMRTQQVEFKKTGTLHGGGARAALVLTACAVEPGEAAAKTFFAFKSALNPPWWRRNPGVTDLYCAAHVARGDEPRVVAQARDRAREVFLSDRRTKNHKHTGARACALFEAEPRTVLKAFHQLDETRRAIRHLRHRVTRDMIMEWAAQGLEPDDLHTIASLIEALPKHLGGVATGRSSLAHLILTQGEDRVPLGEVSALAAIIAAQTAAMTATMVAATSATTAATTSS